MVSARCFSTADDKGTADQEQEQEQEQKQEQPPGESLEFQAETLAIAKQQREIWVVPKKRTESIQKSLPEKSGRNGTQ